MKQNVTDEFRECVAKAIEELRNKKHGSALWTAVITRAEQLYKQKKNS